MKSLRMQRTAGLAAALALGAGLTGTIGCDNRNERAGVTPTDQSENAADREISQKIRQAIVADDSLSTTAKNVKVITTADGVVTLTGNVTTPAEKTNVVGKAKQIAGSRKVIDDLQIASR
jgi:hyperosmotically inducible periplasmic protein